MYVTFTTDCITFYFSQKNSVEAISLLVQDYHSRSAIREFNGELTSLLSFCLCLC